ncbi:MAG: M20/M25/M40 family metallo-hydrolase [Pseudomonadota bacterium]
MEEILALTQDLIRFQSVHARPEEIHRCAAFLARWLAENDLPCRRWLVNGVPSLAVLPETGTLPVLLMSHIDVVDAPAALFSPRVEGGRLYGRGAIDDKYAVALSMVLCREQWRRARSDARPALVGLLITGDEEVGGHNGAKPALAEIRPGFCIALDGGRVDKIVTREKGLIKMRLVARGRAAHGARPWMGENAIDLLIDDYLKIKAYFGKTTADHWHRTLNFGLLRSGESHNQVPDRAEGVLDIRYTEEDDVERLLDTIRRQVTSEVTVEMLEPMFVSTPSVYQDMLVAASGGASVGFAHGASDARFLGDLGIPGVIWGADGEYSQHSSQEHVVIDSVHRLYGLLDGFFDALGEGGNGPGG